MDGQGRRNFEVLERLMLEHRLEEAIDFLARLTAEEIQEVDREFRERERFGEITLPPWSCRS